MVHQLSDDRRLSELALFAGAGGGILGSILLGHRVVCAVEIDPYCREILLRRQEEGILPPFPIWDDVRTFDGRPWRGKVDCVSAGFPCQPFSVAGKQKAQADDRNLWPETIRVIREVGPRWCLLENVPALLTFSYYGTILGDLAESGFNVQWGVLSAGTLGAPHRRQRLWIVAANATEIKWELPRYQQERRASAERPLADLWFSIRYKGHSKPGGLLDASAKEAVARGFCGMDDGLAEPLDRLAALGNGQVPLVAATAWRLLSTKKPPLTAGEQ